MHKFGNFGSGAHAWLTNYRLFVLLGSHQGFYNTPLGCIDTVELRDGLIVLCKDATTIR